MRHVFLPAVLCLALVACSTPTKPKNQVGLDSGGTSDVKAVGARAEKGVTIKVGSLMGKVSAPSGFTPGHGAPKEGEALPTVAKPAASTPAGDETSLKAEGLAGVEVFLGSRKGERYKGPSIGKTDINGNFKIEMVPQDLTFLIFTDTRDPNQRHTEICAMARQVGDGKPFDLTLSSTIVTVGAVNTMSGPSIGNVLGMIDFSFYFKATAAVDAKLQTLKLKDLPDLSSPTAVQAFLQTVQVGGVPLSSGFDQFRAGLNTGGVDANQTQEILNRIGQIQLSGQGSATANGQTQAGAGSVTLDPSQLGGIDLSGFGFPAPAGEAGATTP